MNTFLILATLSLGLSESIETRLPEDPGMIYTVGFRYEGVKVGLDWKNRAIVTSRVCRKASSAQKTACISAARRWLVAECNYYDDKRRLTKPQKDMQRAVCAASKALDDQVALN